MGLLSPLSKSQSGVPVFDNTKRVARLADRFLYYSKVAWSALGHIPPRSMIRSHFPWLLPDGPRPASITVEFTNYCNLQCPYCTSPLGLRPRGFMSESTFERLCFQIEDFAVPRVRIVGNGESTLHPRFAQMVKALGRSGPYLQMVTNGQKLNEEKIEAILTAPVRLLEISVDSNQKEEYEASRIGGNFERLLANLALLRQMKQKMRAPVLVNIRAMIRPSQIPHQREILSFWRRHADTAMPQYVLDYAKGNLRDVFPHHQLTGLVPRCTYPSRVLVVHWNGKIPICEVSQRQTGIPDGFVVGNLRENTLREIWHASVFRQYREGHKTRNASLTPICKGCVGA